MTNFNRIEKTEDSTKYYKKFGEEWKLHREDGPAIEHKNGTKEWYIKGKRHREDGPAIEYPNRYKAWYIKGKLHRENGPAIERANGFGNDYYLNDIEYTKEEYDKEINQNKHSNQSNDTILSSTSLEEILEMPEFQEYTITNFSKKIEKTEDSIKYFKKFGEEWKLHREDGPAIEYKNGEKHWFLEGKLHREDGPAIECVNGTKNWILEGELHREDGPAVERSDGDKYWYLKGKYHREDGPALECSNGDKYWFLEGKRHREDGPAIEYANGIKAYYLNGKAYTKEEYDKEINQNKHSNESNETILSTQKAYFEKLLEKHGYQESIFQEIVKIMMLERTNKK